MDYKSYKAMCDSTLQQIRESENKREELNNKLQKMYQEKSECEKSIIKTLQSQQKQFMDEKRRRAERNENILRTLERVDYQAQLLASKTERLRALKRQYERYLLSLWTTRKATETSSVYSLPQNLKTIGNIQRPFTAKYDESPIHQSSYYMSKASAFVTDLRPSNYLLNAPSYISISSTSPITTHTYQNNQSMFREVPLTSTAIAENSIISSNYHERALASSSSPAVEIEPSSYPSTLLYPQMIRYDYTTTQMPMVYTHKAPDDNNMNKKSFHPSHDNAINIGDMNQPTTINSIYSHKDLQHPIPQLPLDEKSSLSSFQSIYNQPQEYHHNYNSDRNMKMSKAYHDNPLIKPIGVGSVVSSALKASTDFMPQQKSPMSFENRLNNDSQQMYNPENSIHMTDADSDDSSESSSKMTFAYKKLDVPHATNNMFDIKFSDTNVQQSSENIATTIGSSDSNTKSINETTPVLVAPSNDIMHQVWEKVIEAEPTESIDTAQHSSSFVIPKIIVEKQIDLTETTGITIEATELESLDIDEKQDRDIPEKLLNQTSYEMEKHSADNRQNESVTSSTSVSYDNLPLTDTEMSIYHYDKQPTDINEQQPQQSSVEYELRNFDDIKISSLSDSVITCESDIKGNNSLSEGNTVSTATTINNINDDKNLKSSPSMALNDKIGEIYRKIEKIEGDYYGEKGKIMENFESRRLSASSLSDEAKIDVPQPLVNKNDDSSKISSLEHQNEFNQNENEREFSVMDIRQHVNDDDAVVDIDKNDKNLISPNEWESNQSEYADDTEGIKRQNESGETQQIDINFQQQPIEYLENPQYPQMYEQNQQSMFENQDYPVPTSSFEDASGNNNNNSAGDYQTSSVEQYSYEPSVQYQQNDPGESQRHQYEDSYDEQQQQQPQQIENLYEQQQQQQSLSLQQSESDANNFNLYNQHQLESNYQQNNYIETSVDDQNPSNYANESVYYDYVDTQNQNYSSDGNTTDVPQTMYDDQNYTQEYERGNVNDVEGSQLNEYVPYQNDGNNIEGNMYQDQSNENNYNGTDSRHDERNFIETSNASHDDTNEYPNTDGSYANTTDIYRTDTTQMTLENANYETQHLVQQSGNENIEQITNEIYNKDDESYHEGGTASSTTSSDVSSKAHHAMDNDNRENVVSSTKRDDIKLVKQLLDSESSDDPNSTRSNLLNTAIKEEVDESDFDFSAN
ncbi:myb-like protein Z [Chironomus tepperi]|uniref:myb-like protein Z n=1 Tax=Chironomus tepperi TaxID=113505 RepID=UPI00391FA480